MKNIPEFKTQKEKFAYLVKNKKELAELKKVEIKFTDPFIISEKEVNKALTTSFKDDIASGVIKRTIIGNTYNWMDSHDDVLCDNCFDKSIKDRGADKIFHLHDHKREITAKVGTPAAVYEKVVSWRDLGINKDGKTMALFMDSNIKKSYNDKMFDQYLSDEVDQHSVGMYYVTLELAINDVEEKEEYAAWLKYIDGIGNKEKALERGYFWAVKEAKLVEISAVLAGSNELTGTIPNKEIVLETVIEQKKTTKSDKYRKIATLLQQ